MARRAAAGLLGIHINLPATVPPEVAAALAGGPVPAGLSEKEHAVLEALTVLSIQNLRRGMKLLLTHGQSATGRRRATTKERYTFACLATPKFMQH
jgi:hypothetical protein